jgi:hypothetical protein
MDYRTARFLMDHRIATIHSDTWCRDMHLVLRFFSLALQTGRTTLEATQPPGASTQGIHQTDKRNIVVISDGKKVKA